MIRLGGRSTDGKDGGGRQRRERERVRERKGIANSAGGAQRPSGGRGTQVGGRAAGGLAKQKGFADELICDERAYGRA